ncbi:MAG: hypothetical protein IMZ66_08420 [Planctomycetes bacterium]|nr:hypothetical protein [Planctomycetota bacterium]
MVHVAPTAEGIAADRLEETALWALNQAKLRLLRADWTGARRAAEAAAGACRGLEAIDARARTEGSLPKET